MPWEGIPPRSIISNLSIESLLIAKVHEEWIENQDFVPVSSNSLDSVRFLPGNQDIVG
jgi:hypothetical protein